MYFASYAITSFALGPGSAVLILGSLVSVAVIMNSPNCVSLDSQEKCYCRREEECRFVDRRQSAETCGRYYLIDAIKPGTQIRRAKLAGHTRTHGYAVMFEEVRVLHLRFQRTFPSFVSSN